MNKNDFVKFVKNESTKIKRGEFELKRRRLNWSHVVKPLILEVCKKFASDANHLGYPYHLSCYPGVMNVNAQTIQFNFGQNDTCIAKGDFSFGLVKENIYEKSCSLVFSQGPTGLIMVLLYPYKSDVHKTDDDRIILHHGIKPESFTRDFIFRILKTSLIYARLSSLAGITNRYSITDKILYYKIKTLDIRSKIKRFNAVRELNNEWLKIIMTALITLLLTLLIQKL